jgi:hypothetical protein
MGKGKKKGDDIAAPPPEQAAAFQVDTVYDRTPSGGLNLKGTAYRRRPMIEILFDTGALSESELKALRHYRHHADIADRSLIRDSLCLQRGGNGGGPTMTTVNAIRVAADCERAAGELLDILRAVVVYDKSLSQWAIDQAGALETRREKRGKVAVSFEPRRKALEIAKLEIRMAAKRVEAELAA